MLLKSITIPFLKLAVYIAIYAVRELLMQLKMFFYRNLTKLLYR